MQSLSKGFQSGGRGINNLSREMMRLKFGFSGLAVLVNTCVLCGSH